MDTKIIRIFMYVLIHDKVYLTVVYKSGKLRYFPANDINSLPKTVQYFLNTHKSREHYNTIFNQIELIFE